MMSMQDEFTVPALAALAHEGRMAVFRLLARRAPHTVSAGELAEALSLPPSTLSVYVGTLTRAGLVRQARDGRFIRYGIALERVGTLLDTLVTDCCRGRPELLAALRPAPCCAALPLAAERPLNVLFVCNGNAMRSILAEAILAQVGQGRFHAFSAGTAPAERLDSGAVALLRGRGHDVTGLRPKPLAQFHDPAGPHMDLVFTLCDVAANADGPVLPGTPLSTHWRMVDPVGASTSASGAVRVYQTAYAILRHRLEALVALPLATIGRLELQSALDAIGRDAVPSQS